jgi:hypothetical protein
MDKVRNGYITMIIIITDKTNQFSKDELFMLTIIIIYP